MFLFQSKIMEFYMTFTILSWCHIYFIHIDNSGSQGDDRVRVT